MNSSHNFFCFSALAVHQHVADLRLEWIPPPWFNRRTKCGSMNQHEMNRCNISIQSCREKKKYRQTCIVFHSRVQWVMPPFASIKSAVTLGVVSSVSGILGILIIMGIRRESHCLLLCQKYLLPFLWHVAPPWPEHPSLSPPVKHRSLQCW